MDCKELENLFFARSLVPSLTSISFVTIWVVGARSRMIDMPYRIENVSDTTHISCGCQGSVSKRQNTKTLSKPKIQNATSLISLHSAFVVSHKQFLDINTLSRCHLFYRNLGANQPTNLACTRKTSLYTNHIKKEGLHRTSTEVHPLHCTIGTVLFASTTTP